MSVRHPELCAVIEKLAGAREPAAVDDVELLRTYADPPIGIEVEDQLDGSTVQLVYEFTDQDAGRPAARQRRCSRRSSGSSKERRGRPTS